MKTLVVCGATASGKTDLSVEMAERIGAEVVSADCMLVYKRLDIGTAKPAIEEMRGIPHHMIDVVEPNQKYSVSDYEHGAEEVLARLEKNRIPAVICGGTGFYIQSVLFRRTLGGVSSDAAIRLKYETIAKEQGNAALFEILKERDAESAERLHPNDVKRVVRALEIFDLTGKRKSEQRDGFQPKREYVAVAYRYPRGELYARIERRVDFMLERGLVDEVRSLLLSGIDKDAQCMQGIGYKEVIEFLENKISYSTMSDKIKQNTRNYAKRQITFFKKLPGLIWVDPHEKQVAERIEELMTE